MAAFDLLIRGGTLVTGGSVVPGDLGISGGKIVAVGKLDGTEATKVVDAAGCLVLPGLVDPHTHLTGVVKSFASLDEGIRTTSRAALCGGTTTLLEFLPIAPERAEEEIDRVIADRSGVIATDFGVHLSLHGPPSAEHLPSAVAAGVSSMHISLAGGRGGHILDDAEILRTMEATAAAGAMCIVHAENPALNRSATARLEAAGHVPLALAGDCRPWYSEGEAARRAVFLAEVAGAPLYVEHLSTSPALQAVQEGYARGAPVFAETCPGYLSFNKDVYATSRGVEYLKSPPLRRREDQEALWAGVMDGGIQSIGTDESTALKPNKEKLLAERPVYEVSGGLNIIELRLPVLYTELVVQRNASPSRLVQVLASNPARLFGLYPRKGSLLPGADADVVIVDPSVEREVRNADLHQGTDHTIYEGWRLRGWPRDVIFGGEVVVANGQPVGDPKGEYLRRGAPETRWSEEQIPSSHRS